MSELGEYLEAIRKRHPRLSIRQMALQAKVGESVINGIIKHGKGARPKTLNRIADRWGNDKDYLTMMRLAGHPLPEKEDRERSREAILEEILQLLVEADTETRIKYLQMARAIRDDDASNNSDRQVAL